jgi:phosphoenolpyruvate carboxylase
MGPDTFWPVVATPRLTATMQLNFGRPTALRRPATLAVASLLLTITVGCSSSSVDPKCVDQVERNKTKALAESVDTMKRIAAQLPDARTRRARQTLTHELSRQARLARTAVGVGCA